MLVVFDTNDPSPVAYENVYEEGDRWVKIKGCNECPLENRRQCCGNCPMFTDVGCYFHLHPRNVDNSKSSDKPWNCCVKPYPSQAISYCVLEFECVRGSRKGQIRRVCDPGGVFVEKQ